MLFKNVFQCAANLLRIPMRENIRKCAAFPDLRRNLSEDVLFDSAALGCGTHNERRTHIPIPIGKRLRKTQNAEARHIRCLRLRVEQDHLRRNPCRSNLLTPQQCRRKRLSSLRTDEVTRSDVR